MLKKHKYWPQYRTHIHNANVRGIEMRFTFEEWLKVWEDSGHLHERGTRKGRYCMARIEDKGHYKLGNVKIILHRDNILEKVYKDSQREAIRKSNLSREYKEFNLTKEQCNKISKKLTGKKHTKEHRKKHAAAVTIAFARRRAIKWKRLEDLGQRLAKFAA